MLIFASVSSLPSIEIFNEIAPLLPHVFPPYTTMAQPLSSLANPPPPSAFDSTSPDHPASLLSRVKLPIEDPNSITPALVLAIAAFSVQGTDEGQALAAEAGRQIIFTRLMAISGETMGSAQGRARRALDVAQAAVSFPRLPRRRSSLQGLNFVLSLLLVTLVSSRWTVPHHWSMG